MGGLVAAAGVQAVSLPGQGERPEGLVLLVRGLCGAAQVVEGDPAVAAAGADGEPPSPGVTQRPVSGTGPYGWSRGRSVSVTCRAGRPSYSVYGPAMPRCSVVISTSSPSRDGRRRARAPGSRRRAVGRPPDGRRLVPPSSRWSSSIGASSPRLRAGMPSWPAGDLSGGIRAVGIQRGPARSLDGRVAVWRSHGRLGVVLAAVAVGRRSWTSGCSRSEQHGDQGRRHCCCRGDT